MTEWELFALWVLASVVIGFGFGLFARAGRGTDGK